MMKSKGHPSVVAALLGVGAIATTTWYIHGRGSEAAAQEAKPADKQDPNEKSMQLYYLEVVTKDVDAVCAAYSAASGVTFGKPDARFGGERRAPLAGGWMIGVRAPMRETEAPVVRPYWLVKDIKAAVAAVKKAGGQVAVEPTEFPPLGTYAIYVHGGVDHGLWEK
jgi:predicted enzyme related to lactoylglutathione lyase